jgi:hypothetical protein
VDILLNPFATLRRLVQKLGPYLLLEILLPGGTLFALLLFVYQRRMLAASRLGRRFAVAAAWSLERCVPRPTDSCRRPFTMLRSEP